MDTLNSPEQGVVVSDSVQILSLDKKFDAATVYVQPYFEESSRSFIVKGRGKRRIFKAVIINDEVKKERWYESVMGDGPGQSPIVLTTRESIPIRNGERFTGPAGQLLLDAAIDNGYVVENKAMAGGRPMARFFVRDDAAEAKQHTEQASLVREALNAVGQLTRDEKFELAWALRQPVRTMTATMVEGIMDRMAIEQPKVILGQLRGKNFKAIALLQRLVGYAIIEEKAGTYRINDEVIGTDAPQAAAWLLNKKNKSHLQGLMTQLQNKSNGTAGADLEQSKESDTEDVDFDELPMDDK